MPRFLETSLVQEGDLLTATRASAVETITGRAVDENEAALFIEMLGLNDEQLVNLSLPLSIGFSDRADGQRRYRARKKAKSA